MDRKLVPFKAWHHAWVGAVGEPGYFAAGVPLLAALEQQNSWTGIVDGGVAFCAGTIALWPTRHTAWALLSKELSQKHMLWITREVRAKLDRVCGRIEFTVRCDFPQGQKWAQLLGFRVETPVLERFGPEQEDHVGYVRIN